MPGTQSTSGARHAEIVGGGISGLSLAALLCRSGWSVSVRERSAEISEVGAGIILYENSLAVFRAIGIGQRLVDAGVPLERADVWDRGRWRIQKRRLAGRALAVPRRTLIALLAGAAADAGAELVMNSLGVAAEPEGVLMLEDGERLAADLVVAADGHRSRIRARLGLTASATMLGSGATRCLVERRRSESEPVVAEHWAGARRVGIMPCNGEVTYAYLSCPESDVEGAQVPISVRSWSSSFPHLGELFERLADGAAVRHRYSHVRCRSWSSGRVAVVGDAAHAMPPTLGQGVGLAVANAAALNAAISQQPLEAGLQEWQRLRRPATDNAQTWSMVYHHLAADWPAPLQDLRSLTLFMAGLHSGIGRPASRGIVV